MDEESLQSSIDTYKQQLQQVETVLQSAGTDGQSDLLQLQKDLQEVIALTEESLLSLKKSKLLSFVDDVSQSSGSHSVPPSSTQTSVAMETRQPESSAPNMDDEFAAFQAALAGDLSTDSSSKQNAENFTTKPSAYQLRKTTNRPEDDDDEEPPDRGAGTDDIAGTQCSVFVTQEWGTRQCHNAIVLSVEPAESESEGEEEIKVRVLFCNPTTKAMLPCPYFLEDKCRFTQDDCRFSHGHLVSLDDLQEFKEHDYSLLTIEAQCLARFSDKVWYPAIIEAIEEDHQYVVRFQSYGTSETVGLDSIIPVAQREDDSDDDSSDDSESDSAPSGSASRQDSDNETKEDDGTAAPNVAWQPTGASSALGEWEAHTRGIGSKIMAMMGYEFGKGLGKDGQGRRDIVEAVVYPQGRSLDKCMELREQKKVAVVGKKRKGKGKGHHGKGQQGKSGDKKKKGWTNVFDIINRKLGGKKVKINELIQQSMELSKPGQRSKDLSNKSTRNLNVQLVKVQEEIRNTSKKMVRLKDSLTRNQRDTVTSNQLKAQILEAEHYLQTLHGSEKRIQQQQNTRDQHKKLTIF